MHFNSCRIFGADAVDEDVDQEDIPIHAFDVVVADECHRGYTAAEQSVWRNTLDHFDAVTIGLTAMPAAHTTSYFKHLVYRYDYRRAVEEGHLVDYDVVNVRSDVRMNGVFLQEGEQVGRVDPQSGATRLDLLEDERRFESTEIESKVTSPDSNRRIIEEIKTYAIAHEQRTGRFPKTLIFAVNDLSHTSHADQLVRFAVTCTSEATRSFRRSPEARTWTGRCSGSASSGTGRISPCGDRGSPHHGRGYSRPRVHCLPPPGKVAHSFRADAGARHTEGRALSR